MSISGNLLICLAASLVAALIIVVLLIRRLRAMVQKAKEAEAYARTEAAAAYNHGRTRPAESAPLRENTRAERFAERMNEQGEQILRSMGIPPAAIQAEGDLLEARPPQPFEPRSGGHDWDADTRTCRACGMRAPDFMMTHRRCPEQVRVNLTANVQPLTGGLDLVRAELDRIIELTNEDEEAAATIAERHRGGHRWEFRRNSDPTSRFAMTCGTCEMTLARFIIDGYPICWPRSEERLEVVDFNDPRLTSEEDRNRPG